MMWVQSTFTIHIPSLSLSLWTEDWTDYMNAVTEKFGPFFSDKVPAQQWDVVKSHHHKTNKYALYLIPSNAK